MSSPSRRRRVRALWMGLAFLLGLGMGAPVASADDAVASAADAVVDAVRRRDAGALDEIARRGMPDPWEVAAVLCRRGEQDAAAALSGAVPAGLGGADLVRYVAGRRSPAPDPIEVLAALRERESRLRSPADADERRLVLDQAIEQADALGWRRMQSRLRFLAGHAARRRGDLEAAERHFRRRVELEEEGRYDPNQLRNARVTLGVVAASLGDHEGALAEFGRALTAWGEDGPKEELAPLYGNIALVHERRGHYREALARLEQALDALADESPGRAELLLQLAGVQHQLGDDETALSMIDDAQRRFAALEDGTGTARCMGQRSAVYGGMEDYPAMLTAAQAVVDRFSAIEDPAPEDRWFLAAGLTNLGYACTKLGRHEEALSHQARALRVAEGLGDPALRASVTSNQALARLESGDLEGAARLYAEVVSLGTAGDSLKERLEGAYGRARVRFRQGRHAEAWADLVAALDDVGLQTAGLAEGQGAEARARHASLFRLAVQVAVARDDVTILWDAIERGRAIALLESLSGRAALRERLTDPTLRAQEDRLRAAERRASALLQEGVAAPGARRSDVQARRRKLEQARAELRDALRRAQRDAIAGARLLYPRTAPMAAVQARLGPGQVLALYAVQQDPAVCLVLRPTGPAIVRLGSPDAIRAASQRLDASDRTSAVEAAPLRELLLTPLGLTEDEELLVSPDGPLVGVPFASLEPTRMVTLVPSASVYAMLSAGGAPEASGVLGLGAPIYAESRRLLPLPGAKLEVEAVADPALTGERATAQALRAELAKRPRWRALHFACHGAFDPGDPTWSGLELTDGRLTVADLAGMRLATNLAVLSACESALGTYYAGEGLLGLTRAMMLAGAPRVIGSLWRVDDEATHALMVRFYAAWDPASGPGKSAARALLEAQAFVRSQEKWKHPYYWAAWVLWGLP